jgi:hypothetical protein
VKLGRKKRLGSGRFHLENGHFSHGFWVDAMAVEPDGVVRRFDVWGIIGLAGAWLVVYGYYALAGLNNLVGTHTRPFWPGCHMTDFQSCGNAALTR